MKLFDDAAKALRGKRVALAYSDGKDSRITLHLAMKHALSVYAFFMEFVPMKFMDDRMAAAEARYGITIHRLPHFAKTEAHRDGHFCFHATDKTPVYGQHDLYDYARKQAGTPTLVVGYRKADSLFRATTFARQLEGDRWCAPIFLWKQKDTIDYLNLHGIGVPDAESVGSTGVGLDATFILWLYQRHPKDFLLMEREFPFVRAIILREAMKKAATNAQG